MNIFRNMRLKPSILTSFVVLTVPVFFTIIAVTYLSNDRIARANAQELVERFRNEAIDASAADDADVLALGGWFGHEDRKSTRLNSSHSELSRMPSSA